MICQSFPVFLIGLFGKNDEQFLKIGAHGMRLFLCVLPLINLNMVGIQYFQATGRPVYSITLNIAKNIFCLMPALYLLPKVMGLDGIWLAYPLL